MLNKKIDSVFSSFVFERERERERKIKNREKKKKEFSSFLPYFNEQYD